MLTSFFNYIRLFQLTFVNTIKNSLIFRFFPFKEVKQNFIKSHKNVHRPLFKSMMDKSNDYARSWHLYHLSVCVNDYLIRGKTFRGRRGILRTKIN